MLNKTLHCAFGPSIFECTNGEPGKETQLLLWVSGNRFTEADLAALAAGLEVSAVPNPFNICLKIVTPAKGNARALSF